MSSQFRDLIIWLTGGSLAFVVALVWTSGAFIDGDYEPMGVDSFLHARRILDTYTDTSAFYQWDTTSFAPTGAYNHWPWSFDFGLALVLKLLVPLTGASPTAILMHLPSVWVFMNCGLLLLICRQLRISSPCKLIAVLCFALMPVNQTIHGVGHIDHNFAELSFVLAALWTNIYWFNQPGSQWRSALAGAVFGLAIGVNISMFILQFPFLLSFGVLWLKNNQMPVRSSSIFAITLILTTFTIAIFSEPLQDGYFAYFYLSWFQVYIAACTGVLTLLLSLFPASLRSFAIITLVVLMLSIPVMEQLISGFGYVATTSSIYLTKVAETRSILALGSASLVLYTGLIILLPVIMAGCVFALFTTRSAKYIVFACHCLFGLSLLVLQYRFNQFGSYALYLAPLCTLSLLLATRTLAVRAFAISTTSLLIAALMLQSFPFLWLPREPGWSDIYARSRPLFLYLGELCEQQPGIVLTTLENANYVRYHTDCSVLGTAMYGPDNLQTKLGTRALQLLNADPQQVLESQPRLDYILVVRAYGTQITRPEWATQFNETGLNGLLLGHNTDFPTEFRLLMAANFADENDQQLGLARLFKLKHR